MASRRRAATAAATPTAGGQRAGAPAPEGPLVSVWVTGQRAAPAQRRGRYVPESTQHPARMLPAIAAHAITAYTRPGDLVLDPMCGIGTTLVEACRLGRDAAGVEFEGRWSDIAAANIRLVHQQGATGRAMVVRGDATTLTDLIPAALHGRFALVVTSPPYGPTVHGLVRPTLSGVHKTANRYSTERDPGNLAHRDWPGLIDGFTQILAGCRHLLVPGGTVVVTARPWRKNGELVDLPSAVVAAGVAAGLVPVERCVALLAALRDGRLVPRPSFFQLQQIRRARTAGIPLHLITHEDVLVLHRPPGGGHPRGRNPGPVWPIPTRPNRLPHFAAFPIDLPTRASDAGCKPGGVVCDPFAGISTTGLAAVHERRSYLGIDINPAYHHLALRRLAPLRLVDPHSDQPSAESRPHSKGEPR